MTPYDTTQVLDASSCAALVDVRGALRGSPRLRCLSLSFCPKLSFEVGCHRVS